MYGMYHLERFCAIGTLETYNCKTGWMCRSCIFNHRRPAMVGSRDLPPLDVAAAAGAVMFICNICFCQYFNMKVIAALIATATTAAAFAPATFGVRCTWTTSCVWNLLDGWLNGEMCANPDGGSGIGSLNHVVEDTPCFVLLLLMK